MSKSTQRTYTCSFCGKNQSEVRRLIAGPHGVYICDECVQVCNQILADEEERGRQREDPQPPPPMS